MTYQGPEDQSAPLLYSMIHTYRKLPEVVKKEEFK
jgi:hypothetical protein